MTPYLQVWVVVESSCVGGVPAHDVVGVAKYEGNGAWQAALGGKDHS